MRRSCLLEVLPGIPNDTFAPNLVIAGIAGKRGLRIYEHSVPTCRRKTRRSSLIRWSLWRAASRSFCQTLAIALKEKKEQ
jgi:dolichol-phosphate mannosyltransferase